MQIAYTATDGLVTDEGRDFNVDWDTIWEVRSRVHGGGWTAEFAIPFSSLRFNPFGVQFQSGDFFTVFPQYQFERLDRPFEIFEGAVSVEYVIGGPTSDSAISTAVLASWW